MNEIFHRTSIRKYQNKSVEDDKIEKFLRAAMAAPLAFVTCYRINCTIWMLLRS